MDKQEYDLKKAEKGRAEAGAAKMRTLRKLALWLIPLALVVGAGFWIVSRVEPPATDYSKAMADEGREHVSEGANVEHKSNPPTSGSHWPVPLSDGVYQTEKPDEAIIHSLEHGRVWISYKPTIPEEVKKKLEKLGTGQALIATPRSANDTDVALAAWARLDTFNLNPDGSLDERRVRDFIARYKNKGPEFIPGSGGGKTYE